MAPGTSVSVVWLTLALEPDLVIVWFPYTSFHAYETTEPSVSEDLEPSRVAPPLQGTVCGAAGLTVRAAVGAQLPTVSACLAVLDGSPDLSVTVSRMSYAVLVARPSAAWDRVALPLVLVLVATAGPVVPGGTIAKE